VLNLNGTFIFLLLQKEEKRSKRGRKSELKRRIFGGTRAEVEGNTEKEEEEEEEDEEEEE
jgi:hypothetical protein